MRFQSTHNGFNSHGSFAGNDVKNLWFINGCVRIDIVRFIWALKKSRKNEMQSKQKEAGSGHPCSEEYFSTTCGPEFFEKCFRQLVAVIVNEYRRAYLTA